MSLESLTGKFSSFRAQVVAFITVVLVLTTLTLYLINQRAEKRITRQVDEYIEATVQATEVAIRSTSEGRYLFDLLDPAKGGTLPVNSESIIRHILVIDSNTSIISDSTDRGDIDQKLETAISDLPEIRPGDLKGDAASHADDRDRTIRFSYETEKTKRSVIIVVSMKRFYREISAAARDRLVAIGLLGLLQVVLISVFSRNLTGPISELGSAAQRVTSGDLDFEVPVAGPREVSRLASTFNGMLAGLRRNRDLEDQLQRAERSAVVGRLASGIAHEIRNPLNFINLSIDYLRDKYPPQPEHERAEYTRILTTIKDELARLNRLVSDFLSYGRPAKLRLREIDARTLVEEVRSLVAANSSQQNVVIDIAADGRALVKADPEQLKTCFSNIMINAVQAMPEGGRLDVELRPVESGLEIDFIDTGRGIDPEAVAQIFEPYYSTKETGIGLGLPLTKKIIEEHGGRIDVSSEPGKGTIFRVFLPRIVD